MSPEGIAYGITATMARRAQEDLRYANVKLCDLLAQGDAREETVALQDEVGRILEALGDLEVWAGASRNRLVGADEVTYGQVRRDLPA